MKKFACLAAPLALAACTTSTPVPEDMASVSDLPTGATRSPSGFATIGKVPPAAWPEDPPPQPARLDTFERRTATGSEADRAKAREDANGPEDFQREVERLMQLLPGAERGNFVELRLARDDTVETFPAPLLGAEVWFKRDAAATLAKYTRDPRFFAKTGGLTESEMQTLRGLWFKRLEKVPGGYGMSSDPSLGRLEISLGVTEAQFREVARREGWSWGDEVDFKFSPAQPTAFADPNLAGLVRSFAREETNATIRLTALGTGRITLKDGCFRLDSREPALVMFGYDAQLGRDAEGYLVVTSPGQTGNPYRIGEPGAWNAPNHVDEDWRDVKALREACGSDPILNVAVPSSQRTFALPYADWVLDYALVNDLTYDQAWDRIMACMAREEREGVMSIDVRDACVTQFNRKGQALPQPLPPPPPG
ncbi:hypothetical protein A6F68_01212 [Tsuneonella dongtanensis]|uniref:Lipoprotein n=1 Tax=Tsuneonella dongtanensis TaxID=692370 RepID=A0A1B2AC41_9SPHN|nr:hypothetical protein [Tsuneonella dongtanensis]ANY19729.1 hypothetical protein A6F68_01212 [Tsuneonella dongtanensis]